MNGYELSRRFFDWCFDNPEKVKPNHIALYFFAIEHCNRLGWKTKFGLPTTMTKEAIGIKSYNTYINALNDLVEWGFIELIERSKNQYSSNIIALSNFNKAHDKALIKHGSKQSESTGQSIGSIDKQVTSNNEPLTMNHIKYPFQSLEFYNQWQRWLTYKKDEHRFTFKTKDSQETALRTLFKDSGGRENVALEMINYSIGNGYKGIFKSKSNGQSTAGNHQDVYDELERSKLQQTGN